MVPSKPLGRKAYGSTGHLPGSRLGPGDHTCEAHQAALCCTKVRDRADRVIVTEKLDGANVAVANIEGVLHALTRSGYLAKSSNYQQHHAFAAWVDENQDRLYRLLTPGDVANMEWLTVAHGTKYVLTHEPLVLFGMRHDNVPLLWDAIQERSASVDLPTPKVLFDDNSACSIEQMNELLGVHGHHGAEGLAEGAVWRLERHGKLSFIVKYVRSEKVDGVYMREPSPVMNTLRPQDAWLKDIKLCLNTPIYRT